MKPVASEVPAVAPAPPIRDALKLGLAALVALGIVLLGVAAVPAGPAGRLPVPRLIYLTFGMRPVFALAGLWLISAVAILYVILRVGA